MRCSLITLGAIGSAFILALSFFGCAAPYNKGDSPWGVYVRSDEFTDKKFTMVTLGSYNLKDSMITETGKLYPFIGYVDNQLLVGVRSGGIHRIPTGNIQIRIDSNEAWLISTSETPTDLLGTSPADDAIYAGLSNELKASFDASNKAARGIMSPYTAATGEKASSILKQMLGGRKLIYRSVTMSQYGSSTGEIDLGPRLREALIEAGIPIPE